MGSVALKFSVIGIYETWLDDCSHSSDILGFNFIHNHRVGRTAGSVGIYLADYLEFKHRADLVFAKDCAESLFVEINRTMGKDIVIGVIYRPPDCNKNLVLSTRLIKPNFCFNLSHRRSTTVSLQTRNSPDCKLRDFILELEQLLSVISEENETVLLMADWNLNLMNHSCHQATCKFLVLMFSERFPFDYPPY